MYSCETIVAPVVPLGTTVDTVVSTCDACEILRVPTDGDREAVASSTGTASGSTPDIVWGALRATGVDTRLPLTPTPERPLTGSNVGVAIAPEPYTPTIASAIGIGVSIVALVDIAARDVVVSVVGASVVDDTSSVIARTASSSVSAPNIVDWTASDAASGLNPSSAPTIGYDVVWITLDATDGTACDTTLGIVTWGLCSVLLALIDTDTVPPGTWGVVAPVVRATPDIVVAFSAGALVSVPPVVGVAVMSTPTVGVGVDGVAEEIMSPSTLDAVYVAVPGIVGVGADTVVSTAGVSPVVAVLGVEDSAAVALPPEALLNPELPGVDVVVSNETPVPGALAILISPQASLLDG